MQKKTSKQTKPVSNSIKLKWEYCGKVTKTGPCKNIKVRDRDTCSIHGKKIPEYCNKTTKKGSKCKATAGKCVFHSPGFKPRERKEKDDDSYCSAGTLRGRRCTKAAINGSKYCFIHSNAPKDLCGAPKVDGGTCRNAKYCCSFHSYKYRDKEIESEKEDE
ncbi:hypothetical protein DICPUDRAFT_79307 [Dictyostelium purpureum]|uniref:Uncharacterized protein n=1 Tax=Dictyostelium purpureum TaxID=5786 RepID=F0ZM70_DICPU|nr:uncharacterized protein DICPUDRAFT_79307 [Dictyostelium purpureum]EGC34979.1 hypothetical protein DICPUDRAFT_79307 [Dictyostelium purpureum]|eukprot:XP_003288504.1 hypothetical protein DICPUDRAFT_79307 [Dictyostelium purpureum]